MPLFSQETCNLWFVFLSIWISSQTAFRYIGCERMCPSRFRLMRRITVFIHWRNLWNIPVYSYITVSIASDSTEELCETETRLRWTAAMWSSVRYNDICFCFMYQSNRSLNIPPRAYPGHLTSFPAWEGGNLMSLVFPGAGIWSLLIGGGEFDR